MAESDQQSNQLATKIAAIFDEIRGSHATHNRKLKELSSLRSSSPPFFFSAFTKVLTPLFAFQRRSSSAERVVRFVSAFTGLRDSDPSRSQLCHQFLEVFLKFLLSASLSASKTARFRACQIISEVILKLPDDVEVTDELWDEVIESMKIRVGDMAPIVRTYAIRALSRFVNDSENSDILEAFLEALELEQSADVRKAILLALPATNATSTAIIDCTLDVSESVRKTAYFVLANKFPIQSLSIKLRTVILQRGLSDRSPAVVKECLKLLKDEWLVKCCNSDPVQLLKFLDVETYEAVGESVMTALLSARMVNISDDQRMQQPKGSAINKVEGSDNASNTLLEPEFALYWREVCGYLQKEAQAKGSDAAATTGTEAEMYAAEASDTNDLLEKVLPATVSDYVELVKAHLDAGPDHRFVARQLLLLGKMLDFSDAANRRVASTFVQDLMHRSLDYEVNSNGEKIFVGDGISLGGDSEWANAVSGLAKKVYSGSGEFEEVILGLVAELVTPCRERAADFLQWMHCLAVTGLLLENTKSFRWFSGKAIEPIELLNSLLLPGAKHIHLDVQRVAIRCLGLYGLLERKPSEELVKQLRHSFVRSSCPISVVAGKALIDLMMWHGPEELDRATGLNVPAEDVGSAKSFSPIDLSDPNSDLGVGILHLLYVGLEKGHRENSSVDHEDESVQAVLGEGFTKILILSENYPSIPAARHSLLLSRVIQMYFFDERKELERLKQCLSVFFEHYPQLSVNHKKHLSMAFVPVVRGMWPGIYGNPGGSSVMVSKLRKRAVQATRFMIQMMQIPLYGKAAAAAAENSSNDNLPENEEVSVSEISSFDFESGEEGLAIRIATEVATFRGKKTAAEKSYLAALCKAAVLLGFRSSEQGAIKLMRVFLNSVMNSVSTDKEAVKEIRSMDARLRALDMNPDQELSPEEANVIFERLELENPGLETSTVDLPPPTPAPPRSVRATQPRRRAVRRQESSSDEEEESSPTSVVPASVAAVSSARAQRASKTAALTKMTASKAPLILDEEIEEGEEAEEGEEVTSEEESGESAYDNEEE